MSSRLFSATTNRWLKINDKDNVGLVFKEGYDDPTYMTFKIEFGDWGSSILPRNLLDLGTSAFRVNNADYDLLPIGLLNCYYPGAGDEQSYWQTNANEYFASGNAETFNNTNVYSAFQYLRSRNEDTRAEYLYYFVNGLFEIQNKYQYIFKKISGIDLLEQFNATQGQRLKDAKITLTCIEGLNLKIRTLFEMYRKAAWDDEYQRWILPENMREFKMIIYIFERRIFHEAIQYSNNGKNETAFMYSSLNADLPVKAFECCPCEFEIKSNWKGDYELDFSQGTPEETTISIKVKNVKTYFKNNLLSDTLHKSYNSLTSASKNDVIDKIDTLMVYDLVESMERKSQVLIDGTSTSNLTNNTINGVRAMYMNKNILFENEESTETLFAYTFGKSINGPIGKLDVSFIKYNSETGKESEILSYNLWIELDEDTRKTYSIQFQNIPLMNNSINANNLDYVNNTPNGFSIDNYELSKLNSANIGQLEEQTIKEYDNKLEQIKKNILADTFTQTYLEVATLSKESLNYDVGNIQKFNDGTDEQITKNRKSLNSQQIGKLDDSSVRQSWITTLVLAPSYNSSNSFWQNLGENSLNILAGARRQILVGQSSANLVSATIWNNILKYLIPSNAIPASKAIDAPNVNMYRPYVYLPGNKELNNDSIMFDNKLAEFRKYLYDGLFFKYIYDELKRLEDINKEIAAHKSDEIDYKLLEKYRIIIQLQYETLMDPKIHGDQIFENILDERLIPELNYKNLENERLVPFLIPKYLWKSRFLPFLFFKELQIAREKNADISPIILKYRYIVENALVNLTNITERNKKDYIEQPEMLSRWPNYEIVENEFISRDINGEIKELEFIGPRYINGEISKQEIIGPRNINGEISELSISEPRDIIMNISEHEFISRDINGEIKEQEFIGPRNINSEITEQEITKPRDINGEITKQTINKPREIAILEFLQMLEEREPSKEIKETILDIVRLIPNIQYELLKEIRALSLQKLLELKKTLENYSPTLQTSKQELLTLVENANTKIQKEFLLINEIQNENDNEVIDSLKSNKVLMSLENIKSTNEDIIKLLHVGDFLKTFVLNEQDINEALKEEIINKKHNLRSLQNAVIRELPDITMYTYNINNDIEDTKKVDDAMVSINDLEELKKNIALIGLQDADIRQMSYNALVALNLEFEERLTNTQDMIGLTNLINKRQFSIDGNIKNMNALNPKDERQRKKLGKDDVIILETRDKNNKMIY